MKGKPGPGGKKKVAQAPHTAAPAAEKRTREEGRRAVVGLKHSLVNAGAATQAESTILPPGWEVVVTWCGLHVQDQMDLPFELLLCVYAVGHLVLQYYNIYRGNLVDADFFAFTLSLAALLRRVAWKQLQQAYEACDAPRARPHERAAGSHRQPHSFKALQQRPGFPRLVTCAAVFALLLLYTVYSVTVLMTRYRNVRLCVLVVPVIAYAMAYTRLKRLVPDKYLKLEWAGDDDASPHDYSANVALCPQMFQSRWQAVLYTACTTTFYVGVLPVVFATGEHLYWPAERTRALTVVVFVNTIVLMSTYTCRKSLLDLVAYANTYGCWEKLNVGATKDLSPRDVQVWRPSITYKCGSLVRFHPDLVPSHGTDTSTVKVDDKLLASASVYRGLGYTNCGVPGNSELAVSWGLFSRPSKTHACLIVVQFIVTMGLLLVALTTTVWAAVSLMVGFNYILLYLTITAKQQTQGDKKLQTLIGRLSQVA